ncbi:MAG: OadG family protein [Bacteroidetes bacterium]|nr:OadG family protein [Bacteroidota bacterium]
MQDTIIDTLAAADLRAAADTIASGAAMAKWEYSGIESIVQGDGVMISIVGIIIVFAALTIITLLIRVLKLIGQPKKPSAPAEDSGKPVKNGVSGEVVAAIALALQTHLFELHDDERTVVTIKRVSRPYSPWSSKLYGMTPSPYKHITKR